MSHTFNLEYNNNNCDQYYQFQRKVGYSPPKLKAKTFMPKLTMQKLNEKMVTNSEMDNTFLSEGRSDAFGAITKTKLIREPMLTYTPKNKIGIRNVFRQNKQKKYAALVRETSQMARTIQGRFITPII